MSLLGYARSVALFYDENGDFVGSKIFARGLASSLGKKVKTFIFNGGSYNVKPLVSRARVSGFNFLFDTYVFVYNLDNPDPLQIKFDGIKPIMNPMDYKVRLQSKLVIDLNNAYKGGLLEFLTLKNIIIGVIVIGVIYYFTNGGSFA